MDNAHVASGTASTTASDRLADRYATALYALADEQGALDSAVQEMEALGRLIDASADLQRMLASPLIDVQTSEKALRAVLTEQGFSKLILDFASVVLANRRARELRAIITGFAALVAARRGVVVAQVATARPLSPTQEAALRARLIEAGYARVEIATTVDPELLGGMTLRVGARLYDTSLRSRLQRLQYAMKGAA
jgi:F-type H+-transporting ATPase subunit delta